MASKDNKGTELVFSDAAPITSTGRPAGPNPFTDAVQRLNADWDDAEGSSRKGLQFTIPTADVNKTKRRLSEAGAALNPPRTVRVDVAKNGDKSTVTFSLRTKIVKTVKNKDA